MKTSVYISDERICAAVGKFSAEKLDINMLKCLKMPDNIVQNGQITDIQLVGESITKLWKDNKFPRHAVSLVLNSGAVYLRRMQAPITDEKRLLQVISNEFTNIDDKNALLYDYRVLNRGENDNGATILATAADKNMLKNYIDAFKIAGIRIKSIDISVSALIDVMSLMKSLKKQTFIVAQIDGNAIDAALFVKGKYYFFNKVGLVAPRETQESVLEIARMLSSMLQFNVSERSGADVERIYLGGLRESELSLCSEVTVALGVTTDMFPASGAARIKTSNERKTFANLGDNLYVAGNLIQLK